MGESESRRLGSWKEISAYLDRTVRTAQRWEQHEGLPTHRHVHQDQSSVYAFTDELDDWQKARTISKSTSEWISLQSARGGVRAAVQQARLRGAFLLKARTAESLLGAMRELQTAIALDPTDPHSYAALAEAYCALSGNEIWAPEDGYPKARAAAAHALSLDCGVTQAHTVLAMIDSMYEWNWTRAEERFETAIELDPRNATAHHWLGLTRINAGKPEQAHEALQRAADCDPLSPTIATNLGRPFLLTREYDRAIRAFQKAFDLDPAFWMAHLFIGWAHSAAGRTDVAVEETRQAMERSNGLSVTVLGFAEACARAGDRGESLRLVEAATTDPQVRYVSPYRIARVYVALGENDAAFHWLDRALADRSIGSMTCLSRDPALDSILADCRFQRYLRAMNVP
jgi:serine/threonine-protein kinase